MLTACEGVEAAARAAGARKSIAKGMSGAELVTTLRAVFLEA
jgi:hypothetical protein